MTEPSGPRIRIGGKTYASLDDLPPETRKKLEQTLAQMRASGALADRNRDGIPDSSEPVLKVLGWVGRLIGKPELRDSLERQIREQLRALGAAPASRPPTGPSAGPSSAPTPPTTGPSAGPASASATRLPRPPTPRAAAKPPPAMVSSNQDPRSESAAAEFIRKLVIVSVLVGLGYLAYRLLV